MGARHPSTFSGNILHRRPSNVPLSPFLLFVLLIRGPFEKSKRRREFPGESGKRGMGSRLLSFSAGLYQDTLGLKRNLGFCVGRGSTLNGVPTFSCWRNHLICIMLLVLLGWRCPRAAGRAVAARPGELHFGRKRNDATLKPDQAYGSGAFRDWKRVTRK